MIEFIQGFSVAATVLLAMGLVFFILEMFTPGIGIGGVAGIVCFLLCIVVRAESLAQALWMGLGLIALIAVLLMMFFRSASSGKLSKTAIINNDTIGQTSGYSDMDSLEGYVGKTGVTATILRPAGIADFNGARLDVVTRGDYIEKDTKIVVIKAEGRRLVVEECI